MTTTIYRVQDQEGRGPFRPNFSKKWIDPLPKPHEDQLEPWPIQFPSLFRLLRSKPIVFLGCACESPDQLRLWFSESEIRKMSRYGYSAVEMTVDEILAKSDVQLVFRRKKPLNRDVKRFDLYANVQR